MLSPASAVPNQRRPSAAWFDRGYYTCLAGLLLLLGVLNVWRPLAGWLDFWAHAAVGRWIWQTGSVPHQTLFLWTTDEPWIYHHWGSQLIFYGLTRLGDPDHLPHVVLAFTTLLVLLPFVLVWLVSSRCGGLSSVLAVPVVLALNGLSLRFQTRPELFTELALCLLLTFLIRWSGRPSAFRAAGITRWDRLAFAGTLVLFVAWANLHGGVVIGLLVVAITAGCDLIQDRFDSRSRVLVLLALLAPMAVCVNPYGFAYWRGLQPIGSYPFAHILEWLPIWRYPPLPTEMQILAAVLVLLAAGAWLVNPQRRWAHLGWMLLTGALFVQARRNIWPFSLTCLMVSAANAQALNLWAIRRRKGGGNDADPLLVVMRWSFRLALLAWIALDCTPRILAWRAWQPLQPMRLEQGVVRFFQQHEPQGRVFNDYENSSYLQWRLAGQPSLYIDLLNAYPDGVMRDYQDLVRATERGRHLLDEQQIEWVVLTTNRGVSSGDSLAVLANYLDATPQWVRVYVGRDGVIWVRRTPQHEQVWGPRHRSVSPVKFATLERWGNEQLDRVPAIAEDFGSGEAERPEHVFQHLRKVDVVKEVKIEIDKTIRDAGIDFSDWRWLDTKVPTIVAKVKSTKATLASRSVGYLKYNTKGVLLGRGSLPSQELMTNQTGLARVELFPGLERTARVVIFISVKK
jgi:hypothetical protein